MTIFSFTLQLHSALLMLGLVAAININAQAPAGMNFQAIAKDLQGNPAKSRTINVKGTILQGNAVGGKTVWEETFEVVTNQDGVFSIQIGQGNKLSGVHFSDAMFIAYFLRILATLSALRSPTSQEVISIQQCDDIG